MPRLQPVSKPPLQFISAGATNVGLRRAGNEDSMLTLATRSASIWGVFDGMGGHGGGDIASQTARQSVANTLAGDRIDARIAERALMRAHDDVSDLGSIGTTGTLLWLGQKTGGIAHVGDSRVYRVRAGLEHLTCDHNRTWLRNRSMGLAGQDKARSNASKDVILANCLGGVQPVPPTVETTDVLPKRGDVYLVFTDGLNCMVPDDVILGVVKNRQTPDLIVPELIAHALAAGGVDNVTVYAVLVA